MGGALIFSLAIFVALAIVGARRFGTWREKRAQLHRPGRDEAAPLTVQNYVELEATWRGERCSCGGRFELVGESTVSGASGVVTVVLLRCENCEARDAIYFDVSAVPN